MKKIILFFTFSIVAFATIAQISLNVVDFGAVGNNSTVNTSAIQQAIDSCYNAGGGEVIVSGGTFISSTIRLKSNVTLRVATGATLKAVSNYNDFPDLPFNTRSWNDTYTTRCFIFAEDASHIRITGGGTIDGNGTSFGYLSVSTKSRPIGLRLHAVDSLIIDSITLRQAPQWMAVIFDCSNVYINRVTVYNQGFGSNDGIDIDCCRNVLVENSNLDTNDDPLPIKTHSEKVCRDVLVRQCTFATYERAVKVGNESLGPLINIRFQDITVNQSSFGGGLLSPQTPIYCAVTDGGSADSIYFERIRINVPSQTPIFIRLSLRGNQYDTSAPAPVCKYVRNVWLKDITAIANSTIPCSITGIPGHPVENIYFENVSITEPGNGPLTTGNVPEQITNRPENDIWGDSLPPYGLYVRHVSGLHLDSFCVFHQAAEARPFYYFEDTSSINRINECTNSVSGILSIEDYSLKVFPNPATDKLFIADNENQIKQLMLLDATGKIYQTEKSYNSVNHTLDLTGLQDGVYLLVVKYKTGERKTIRFVKE